MFLINSNIGIWWRCVSAQAVVMATCSALAQPQPPKIGDVQKLPVITVSLQVGSTESKSKRCTYTPPPGWFIRSHTVECTERYGFSSYSISTIPAGWTASSDEQSTSNYQQIIEVAAKVQNMALQAARLKLRGDDALHEQSSTNCSHHALVLDATAMGEGLFRGGGGIEITVTAELVYLGVDPPVDAKVSPRLGIPK